jgi:hypothetical protein
MKRRVILTVHGILGWALCGATIGMGRQFMSLDATLLVHAVVAPAAFGLLSWHYFTRFPGASPAATSLAFLGIVIGLDGLVVAPFIEHSYAMFRSVLGTWVPFASILIASYVTGRIIGNKPMNATGPVA